MSKILGILGACLVLAAQGCGGKLTTEREESPVDPAVATVNDKQPSGESDVQGDVAVAYERSLLTNIGFEDAVGRPHTLEDVRLVVMIGIGNRSSTRKVEYNSWQGDRPVASLTDEHGNRYRQVVFHRLERVLVIGERVSPEAHGGLEAIHPGKAITDALVFEQPVTQAKTLRLVLPRSNYGGNGDLVLTFRPGRAADWLSKKR